MARQDKDVRELSQRFVCVRMVKMNGVDLRQFQFDYDMTWAAFFLHHDGTVFARYGTRSIDGPMGYNSAKGLLATMRRVLDVYQSFPAKRELFAGKKGPDPGYETPESIPSRRTKGRRGRIGRGNCIHCHNVHEAFHDVEKRTNNGRPKRVFKFPLPENIGLVLDRDQGTLVREVREDSAAQRAGVRKGDVVETLGGQAILSIADVQFVLHHADDVGSLEIGVRRANETLTRSLKLTKGWRTVDFTWRQSLEDFPGDRGLYVHRLGAAARDRLGIAKGKIALEVRGLFKPAVANSGLQTGDVIVGYDGLDRVLGAVEFQSWMRVQHHAPGSRMKLRVLRAGAIKSVEVGF